MALSDTARPPPSRLRGVGPKGPMGANQNKQRKVPLDYEGRCTQVIQALVLLGLPGV